MSTRELAHLKRELYEASKILRAIEARKAEFLRVANEQANQLVQQAEAEMGVTLPNLRKRQSQLLAKLQAYMKDSNVTQIKYKRMLADLRYEVVNRGNMPLWSVITQKMGDLLKWSKEELETFIKANYSLPEHGFHLYLQFLDPAKKKKPDPPTTAFFLPDTTMQRTAALQDMMFDPTDPPVLFTVTTPTEHFILTADLVREHGLAEMLIRQGVTKAHCTIDSTSPGEGRLLYVAVDSPFATDVNTVRAFIHDQFPGCRITGAEPVSETRVALAITDDAYASVESAANEFFDFVDHVLHDVVRLNTLRQELVTHVDEHITAGFSDSPSEGSYDQAFEWERHAPVPESHGNTVGFDPFVSTP
jgi:hypothetical protein